MRPGKNAVRSRWTPRVAVAIAAAVLIMGAAAAASITILSQTVPSGTAPSAGFSAGCPTLTMNSSSSGANATSAEAVYSCVTAAALTVTRSATHTPSYALPPAFNAAFLIPSTPAGAPNSTATTASCTSYPGNIALVSGSPVGLPPGSFDYCFNSASPGAAIASFAVSWS